MNNFFSDIRLMISNDNKIYNINWILSTAIFLSPFSLLILICIFKEIPLTRPFVVSIIVENQLVMGSLTSIFLFMGGLLGLRLVLQIIKYEESSLAFWFYLALSIGFLIIGMEKIRWGQLFFISNDPAISGNINLQSETAIHNIQFLRRRLEIFPMTFGIIGLFGIWRSKREKFCKISSPYILWPWFLIIAAISAIDLLFDFYKYFPMLKKAIDELEEVIEMMVSISALLFIWLNMRRFRFGEREIV